MKIWHTIMMAALQAAGVVATTIRNSPTKQRVSYVPTQAPATTSHEEPVLAEVIDFVSAKQRIYDKRALSLGVRLE